MLISGVILPEKAAVSLFTIGGQTAKHPGDPSRNNDADDDNNPSGAGHAALAAGISGLSRNTARANGAASGGYRQLAGPELINIIGTGRLQASSTSTKTRLVYGLRITGVNYAGLLLLGIHGMYSRRLLF
jgi:hypothetical protein